MDDSRDVQTSKRNDSSRSILSSASSITMEIKRKKTGESSNTSVQAKLDFEMRMREGAYKLLLACSKREQVLNASKNLLTCNARIKAYQTLLQRQKEEQGLRIPLLWSDSEHFNNKGTSRRVAVFCLIKMGSDVFDTEMVVLDRSVTDVCFEGVTIFKDAVPEFELRVELWSCALEEELTVVNTPKKLAKKFRNSFGRASEKKFCSLLESAEPDTFLQHNPIPNGAKYSLLAYTTLGLPEAEGSFQSHSLIVLQDAEWSSWLPLYGNLCCQLVAQPVCMAQNIMSGYLNHKQSVEGMSRCCNLYCVLSAGFFSCYFSPEEIDAKVQPCLRVPVTKETRIRVVGKESAGHKSRSLSIINPSPEGSQTTVFITDTNDELENWLDALHQHIYDQSQWLRCCDSLMKIVVASPRKPSLFLTKQADSVYNELSISSPGKFESITDIIHSKIEETDGSFLIGCEDKKEAPNWSNLFDGSHSLVVEKSTMSHSRTSTPCSSPKPNTNSTPLSSKKRRAPPPPSDKEPFPPPSNQEKENSGACITRPTTRSKTGRPSLDAKFSAIIQQLQRSSAGGSAALRKNAPLGILEVQPQGEPHAPLQQLDNQTPEAAADGFVRAVSGPCPVPAPRSKLRKSFRENDEHESTLRLTVELTSPYEPQTT
uniref:Rhotekin 2 n=1 Tax=Oryzias latipes TaxID=8090 RepID=H2LIY8_ORYLA